MTLIEIGVVVGGILILTCSGCQKDSNPGPFWTDRAGSREQVTPAFGAMAKRLAVAIRKEREDLDEEDQKFKSSESAVWKLREEAAKQIGTHADRDIYWRLDGYAQKVSLVHNLTQNQAGSAYLPALRAQVESCGDERLCFGGPANQKP